MYNLSFSLIILLYPSNPRKFYRQYQCEFSLSLNFTFKEKQIKENFFKERNIINACLPVGMSFWTPICSVIATIFKSYKQN